MASITLTGAVVDIGHMDGAGYGITIESGDGQQINVSGMTAEQVRSIKALAFEKAEITIKEPA